MSVPQIKCPSCKTTMNYTAAECSNCKRRMVATENNPNAGSGLKIEKHNVAMGISSAVIAFIGIGAIIFIIAIACNYFSKK